MPLVAAAVCPHPPLIVPELAGAAVDELEDLRFACAEAVDRLLAAVPDTVLLLGGAARTVRHGPSDHGSLRPYGLDRVVRLGRADDGRPDLPLSLLIGAWLLHRAEATVVCRGQSVASAAPTDECRRLGDELANRPDERVALLVMGDGSACRGERSPGYDDPRARPYDDRVAAALGQADAAALLGLEPELATRLRVAGRAPWQVLAAAVLGTGVPWQGHLSYYAAPYGVSYFVANWSPIPVAGAPTLPGGVSSSPGAAPTSAGGVSSSPGAAPTSAGGVSSSPGGASG